MSEDIISMLSNMGALERDKAISAKLLSNSDRLKHLHVDEDIRVLEEKGYIKRAEQDKVYLTESGLVRALSRFS